MFFLKTWASDDTSKSGLARKVVGLLMFNRKKTRRAIQDSDDLDIISAVWILASNDENPAITYEGVRYRLGLPKSFDIKKLIASRADLFRQGIPFNRLEAWKDAMRENTHLPSWIRDLEVAARDSAIDALTTDDIFRSQFRSEDGAARSPIEIIDWGLQHIDRLRKAGVEAREERFRWITGLAVPLFSMVIALTAVLTTFYSESRRTKNEVESKKYETTFRIKEDAYISFMKALGDAYDHAYRLDAPAAIQRPTLIQSIDRLETAYYSLEPFLDKQKQWEVWNEYQKFVGMCLDLEKVPESPDREKYHDRFLAFRLYFRTQLYESLFPK
jgi:hypothetical protein